LFVDKEDPTVVYVQLRTKLKQSILADFFLEDAVRLLKRLHDAFSDTLVVTKAYTEKTRLTMALQKDNPKYSRHQGLKDASRVLGLQHQHDFDAELNLHEDAFQLREPFSRDLRRKMMDCQKYLTGNDRHVKLGNLKPSKLELCGWYATGAVPKPALERANTQSNEKIGKNFQTPVAGPKKAEKRKHTGQKKEKKEKEKKKDKVEKKKSDKGKTKLLTTAKLQELEQFKLKMAQVRVIYFPKIKIVKL